MEIIFEDIGISGYNKPYHNNSNYYYYEEIS